MSEINDFEFSKNRVDTIKKLIKSAFDENLITMKSTGKGGVVDCSVDKYLELIESMNFDEFVGLCGAIAITVDQKYTFTEEDHIHTSDNIKSTIVNETLYWHENVIDGIIGYDRSH